MKRFKDFYLSGDEDKLLKFKERISAHITGDWQESKDSKFKENFIVIGYLGEEVNKASVFLYIKNINELQFKITNIVPLEKNSLNYDEYNKILDKCINECIIPCAKECGLSYETTSENVNLENYMSNESAEKLRRFSLAANKSTGSSHPSDQERWNDFICETFISGDKNVNSILGRWLVEEDGWDEENASDLIIQYEQGISLLSYYKEHYYE